MGNSSQKRALQNYRKRLGQRGMGRFEVIGLVKDRELIRSLARRLARGDADASHLRDGVAGVIGASAPRKGGILAALRRSPLVGVELDLQRPRERGRKVDL